MSLILRQVIGYEAGKRTATLATADPELKRQLEESEKGLNAILKKWKWDGNYPRTSEEFISKFAPWVEEQVERKKAWNLFLAKKGVNNLEEAESKLTNRELSENEELENLRSELEEKQQELARKEQTFLNTEQDYLRRIEELQATRTFTYEETDEEVPFPSRQKLTHDLEQAQQEIARLRERNSEELETERDELARDKLTLEQETLSLNNRLNLKQQEVTKKEQEITRLKKEKSDQATSLNKKLTDLKKANQTTTNLLLETQKAQEELKKKYSKQGKLLDEEQCENNKLTEKIESLEEDIKILKNDKKNLLDRLADKYGKEEE
jgi:hypothetical protein